MGGRGCPRCGNSLRSSTPEFINKAVKVHGDKYDYLLVIYVNNESKVIIRCKSCNLEFLQTPKNHLHGQGCPHCNISKGESHISVYLKSVNIPYIKQKRYVDCRGVGNLPLSFDFYIPSYN